MMSEKIGTHHRARKAVAHICLHTDFPGCESKNRRGEYTAVQNDHASSFSARKKQTVNLRPGHAVILFYKIYITPMPKRS